MGGSDKGDLATVEGVSVRGKCGQRRPKRNGRIVDPNVSLWSQNSDGNAAHNPEGNRDHPTSAVEPRLAWSLMNQHLVAADQENTGNRKKNDRTNRTIETTRPKCHGPGSMSRLIAPEEASLAELRALPTCRDCAPANKFIAEGDLGARSHLYSKANQPAAPLLRIGAPDRSFRPKCRRHPDRSRRVRRVLGTPRSVRDRLRSSRNGQPICRHEQALAH